MSELLPIEAVLDKLVTDYPDTFDPLRKVNINIIADVRQSDMDQIKKLSHHAEGMLEDYPELCCPSVLVEESNITYDRLKVLLYNTITLYEEALDTSILPLEDVLDELGMSKEEYCEIMGVETC